MPFVDINVSSSKEANLLKFILPKLREFIAKELTCGERTIQPEEVSIQIFTSIAQLPIANIEVKITAYSYPERVKRQDEICLAVKNFILTQELSLDSVFVWLQLSELGHSIQE